MLYLHVCLHLFLIIPAKYKNIIGSSRLLHSTVFHICIYVFSTTANKSENADWLKYHKTLVH